MSVDNLKKVLETRLELERQRMQKLNSRQNVLDEHFEVDGVRFSSSSASMAPGRIQLLRDLAKELDVDLQG